MLKFKRCCFVVSVLAVLFLMISFPLTTCAANEPIKISFAVWTYDLETVRSNLTLYEKWMKEEEGLDVEVQLSDFGYGRFDANITTTFMGGNSFDVFYGSDHWLPKWEKAGWIIPVEDYFPQVTEYKDKMDEFTLNSLIFDGKMYGLPYYTNAINFVYNATKLKELGINESPKTWDELYSIAERMRKEGVLDAPISLGLATTSWFEDLFFALAYSRGAEFFDDDWNVVFSPSEGPVYEAVEWLRKAFSEGLIPNVALEQDVVDIQEIFKKGKGAFTLVPGYMLAELNIAEASKIRGDAKLAMIPGTGITNAFSRVYVMAESAVNEGEDKKLACWKLLEFMGGKTDASGKMEYYVTKKWATRNRLGFAYQPLWDDPEVQEAFSAVGNPKIIQKQKANAKAKAGLKAPWYPEWISDARPEIQAAIMGRISTEKALQNIINGWNYFKD